MDTAFEIWWAESGDEQADNFVVTDSQYNYAKEMAFSAWKAAWQQGKDEYAAQLQGLGIIPID